MKRPSISDVSRSYLNILNWVKLYVDNDDEAQTLTNQLHYLFRRRFKKSVAVGILIGWVTLGLLLSWAK